MFKFLLYPLLLISNINAVPLWSWNQTTNYFLAKFPPNKHSTNYISSSCGGGWNSNQNLYAFACPHMMMFSEDMILASKYDKLSTNFYYAVAGGKKDSSGMCFQVKLTKTETPVSKIPYKDLIIQVINSGSDVSYQQFDIFMGAGGFGIYDACNNDCQNNHCSGGACNQALYKGSFSDWTNSQYQSGDVCYKGGVKWFPPYNETLLKILCSNLYKGDKGTLFKNVQLYKSCFTSNKLSYHQNFNSYQSTRVQCPKGLYLLTGLRRTDDVNFPKPNKYLNLPNGCEGTCTTSMMDCCKASSSWYNNNPNYDPNLPEVYSCDVLGFPYM